MNIFRLFVGMSLFFCVSIFARSEPKIGMSKSEFMTLFSNNIISEDKTAGITTRMQFLGHDAKVYVSFYRSEKATSITVSFTSIMTATDRTNRLSLFGDIRRRLSNLSGHEYSYARIDGIDLLGADRILEERLKNAFAFCTESDGLIYQIEIVADRIEDMSKVGAVRLTIDDAKMLQTPSQRK